jgi:hypothetical protein
MALRREELKADGHELRAKPNDNLVKTDTPQQQKPHSISQRITCSEALTVSERRQAWHEAISFLCELHGVLLDPM